MRSLLILSQIDKSEKFHHWHTHENLSTPIRVNYIAREKSSYKNDTTMFYRTFVFKSREQSSPFTNVTIKFELPRTR